MYSILIILLAIHFIAAICVLLSKKFRTSYIQFLLDYPIVILPFRIITYTIPTWYIIGYIVLHFIQKYW